MIAAALAIAGPATTCEACASPTSPLELLRYGEQWLCRPCWCKADRLDELDELLGAELANLVAVAQFEARFEVDPPAKVIPIRLPLAPAANDDREHQEGRRHG